MNDEVIGVLGLGTIGLKLTEYLAEKGFTVIAYNWRNIDKKTEKYIMTLERKIKYEKISYEILDVMKSRVSFTDSMHDLSICSIVIDTQKEDYSIKTESFAKLLDIVGKETLLASCTSSLSLQRLGDAYDPERFFGLHFFNPPTRMRLIELSFLPQFQEAKRTRVYRFLRRLDDKKIIEMPPIQGYIVNRLLFVYINYAISFLEETGLGSENIDEAMKCGTNVPMGPLELSDYIGNDVSLEILDSLYNALQDERYKAATLLRKMVDTGRLGRKTKNGFYQY